MKLTATKSLVAEYGMARKTTLAHLDASGIKPQQTVGGDQRKFCFWGDDARNCLQAHRDGRDAARAAKLELARAKASSTPKGFSSGKLGVIERQLTAIMASMLAPAEVHLSDSNIASFEALYAAVQGQIATVSDLRGLVLELTGRVGVLERAVNDLRDAVENPLAGPAAEAALEAAMTNGHDDADLRAAR